MSVIRVKHQKNYVVINKLALENPRLSFKAKGLWAYCMSRPDDWEFHVDHLKKVSKEKKTAIYAAIKELIDEGYCHKIQSNKGKGAGKGRGSFGSVDYEIHEEPDFSNNLSLSGFPHAGHPLAGNQPLLSNDVTKGSSSSPSFDVKEDEPNRTEEGSDRDGSDRPLSADEEKKPPSLEMIQAILDHVATRGEGKMSLKHSDIRQWVKRYGLDRTVEVIDMAIEDQRSGSMHINPAGWITNALKKGY